MKYLIRLYRLLKPMIIYTSYLFTAFTILYLLAHVVFPGVLPFHAGMIWGILFFSMGSILAQRMVLGSELLHGLSYLPRLFLYLCAAGIWGYGCLRFFEMLYRTRTDLAVFLLILLFGLLCCAGLELFNRCRAHMYNTLLAQYKRRRGV